MSKTTLTSTAIPVTGLSFAIGLSWSSSFVRDFCGLWGALLLHVAGKLLWCSLLFLGACVGYFLMLGPLIVIFLLAGKRTSLLR